MAAVERELLTLRANITTQQESAQRYSGGLVHAVSLSTIATMGQTEVMLDQRRLALKYALPQFIALKDPNLSPVTVPKSDPEPIRGVPADSRDRNWQIVGIESRVTESNQVWWRYAWRLTLKNDAESPKQFNAEIEFQDADGFVIHSGTARVLIVPADSQEVFTGYELIRLPSAQKVARTNVKVRQS